MSVLSSLWAFLFHLFCNAAGLSTNSTSFFVWIVHVYAFTCTCLSDFRKIPSCCCLLLAALTYLWDFLPSVPPGPDPQSCAWMMKVYSFCSSQSTRPRALSWPSPDVPFSTTASNGASSPWMLNAQISPRDREEGRGMEEGWGQY